MVDNDAQPQKKIKIVGRLKFTFNEESQYREEEDELKAKVMELIKNKRDDELVESITDMNQIQQAMGDLKTRVVSCGEQNDDYFMKNVTNKVICDPKNVIFRLIHFKKRQIDRYLQKTITNLHQTAEIRWLKNNIVETAGWYNTMADIFVDIDKLNDRFVEKFGSEEAFLSDKLDPELTSKLSEQEKSCLSGENFMEFHRKRRAEEEKRFPQKKRRRLEDESNEKGWIYRLCSEKKMAEIRNSAMQPIRVDGILLLQGLSSVEKIGSTKEVKEQIEEVENKLGGKKGMSKKCNDAMNQCSEAELNNLQQSQIKKKKILNEWMENENQFHGIVQEFRAIAKSYSSKNSTDLLIEKESWNLLVPLLQDMSFWPIFKNSKQHLIDGQVYGRAVVDEHHNRATCMGVCNRKSFEDISLFYKASTYPEVLLKMCDFIEYLDEMRKELLADYSKSMYFFRNLKPRYCLSVRACSEKTLFCDHKLFETRTISFDETTRKREKKELKCRICSLLHTLAHFRFAFGAGSFHGEEKIGIIKFETLVDGTEKIVDKFVSMVLKIERSKNSQIDGSKELSDFQLYIDRLSRTAAHIQYSLNAMIAYSVRMYNITCSQVPVRMIDLKQKHKDEANWSDEQLLDFALDQAEQEYHSNKKKLNRKFGELRYMINLYGNDNVEWYKEEDCVLCDFELEAFVNFPCGHKICDRCYRELKKRKEKNGWLYCVTCREPFFHHYAIAARGKAENTEDKIPDAIPGMTLSVKLNTTIHLIKEIFKENPLNNNIILLTELETGRNLKYLETTLQKAMVQFVELVPSPLKRKIFIWSNSMLAKNPNHVQANHIIMLDPPLLSPYNTQAIDDYKKNQSQDVKVYRMIVEDSIDEELWKFAETGKTRYETTVGDIRQIFGITP